MIPVGNRSWLWVTGVPSRKGGKLPAGEGPRTLLNQCDETA